MIGPDDAFIIGEGSYINDAILTASTRAKVTIGAGCTIGYRVSIKAITHDVEHPCAGDNGEIPIVERGITIGNACWIGDNVFIREGVSIGNHVIVGANSVVTKSIPDGVIVAGAPAVAIRGKTAAIEQDGEPNGDRGK
ncbi:MAG: acyltransferase [Candidatus Thiosymbion ectosymbiont of Robbea hypermnestra]|nr:acyltransferase [Candidatus Thiosymbion ectosymbiont of Robbea hypermnestra]